MDWISFTAFCIVVIPIQLMIGMVLFWCGKKINTYEKLILSATYTVPSLRSVTLRAPFIESPIEHPFNSDEQNDEIDRVFNYNISELKSKYMIKKESTKYNIISSVNTYLQKYIPKIYTESTFFGAGLDIAAITLDYLVK